jgi:hypothetical protein
VAKEDREDQRKTENKKTKATFGWVAKEDREDQRKTENKKAKSF